MSTEVRCSCAVLVIASIAMSLAAPVRAGEDPDTKFGRCLTKAAQVPGNSSLDGGKSARMMLLKDCPDEYFAWVEDCMHAGDSKKSCVLKAAILAQAALKFANK